MKKQNFRSFEKAREFVRGLGLKNLNDWKKYCDSGGKPEDIPKKPCSYYKNKGWIGYSDWFTDEKIEYLSYKEANSYVKTLQLKNWKEWKEFSKSEKMPVNIPKYPAVYYRNDGWEGNGKWLGTNYIATRNRKFRPFKEARLYAISLNLKDNSDWENFCISGNKPVDIPRYPDKKYKNDGWINMADWLTGDKYNSIKQNLSFIEAKSFMSNFNLKSVKDWEEFRDSGKRPNNIPYDPNSSYVNKGWKGWPDFLGYLGNGNLWTKSNIILYLQYFKDSMHVLSERQLIAIISSNGLDRYLKNDHLKKLQETIPNSPERYTVVETIIKEITEDTSEELEILNEEEQTITDQSINDRLNNDVFLDEDKLENVNEIREKQLKALDTKEITHSLDSERVKFIINDFVNTLWYDELNGTDSSDMFSNNNFKNEIPLTIKEIFLEENEMVKNLKLPNNWIYPHEPLLMQKLIAYRLKERRRYGNWSGVGSGKTVSGILAGQYVGAKNTLVITFNSTIGHEDQRGWTKEIKSSVKNANIYTKVDKNIKFKKNSTNYLVLNYEAFQQTDSIDYVINLLDRNKFDFVILDEVQSIKQAKLTEVSKRRQVIMGLLKMVEQNNPEFYLLAMSATPVINNLVEAKSLIELIEFRDLHEINTIPTIHNCIEVFQRLTNCGIRYKNIGDNILKDNKYKVIQIEANDLYSKAKRIKKDNFLEIDKLLLETKLEAILPYINTSKGKTVIYSYYVDGIIDYTYDYLTSRGFKVGVYTGAQDKHSREDTLQDFIDGDYDVLLGSKPIGTGVDGLQKVSDRLIILSLPWTNAELIQLIGRINRKWSSFIESGVDVIIPLVSINGYGKSFRWDYHRFNTITYKKTIANAAVDGIIPDKILPSKEKFIEEANSALPEWIERLNKEKEEITCVE